MARITRKVATITLVINAKSDEDPFSPGYYIGGQSDDQLETTFKAFCEEFFSNQFPREHKKSNLEVVSVAVSIA